MASTLNDFISKFNSSEQKWVDTIDTLHTFDINFAFYPNLINPNAEQSEKEFLEGLVDNVVTAAAGAVKNAINNVTGGLLAAWLNDVDIMKMRGEFSGDGNFQKTTNLDYISRGNLLVQDSKALVSGPVKEAVTPQLQLDFSLYVQNASLPQITTGGEETSETLVGNFPINGRYVKPSANNFQLNFINTRAPLMERIFYPWLRETTLPYWAYSNQPYTTANVTIDFNKHADFKYLFVGCRPSNIETLQPSNELGSPTRLVHFVFDHMFVLSDLKATKSIGDTLLDTGKALLGGAGTTLGL